MALIQSMQELNEIRAAKSNRTQNIRVGNSSYGRQYSQTSGMTSSAVGFQNALASAREASSVSSGIGVNNKYDSIFTHAARTYGISKRLLMAVAKIESDFVPTAVSRAGAQGIMQIMPYESKELGVKNPFDPFENIMAGAKMLRDHLKTFGSVPLALAAYNAGPDAVRKYKGVPPYNETQAYVKAITKLLGDSSFQVSGTDYGLGGSYGAYGVNGTYASGTPYGNGPTVYADYANAAYPQQGSQNYAYLVNAMLSSGLSANSGAIGNLGSALLGASSLLGGTSLLNSTGDASLFGSLSGNSLLGGFYANALSNLASSQSFGGFSPYQAAPNYGYGSNAYNMYNAYNTNNGYNAGYNNGYNYNYGGIPNNAYNSYANPAFNPNAGAAAFQASNAADPYVNNAAYTASTSGTSGTSGDPGTAAISAPAGSVQSSTGLDAEKAGVMSTDTVSRASTNEAAAASTMDAYGGGGAANVNGSQGAAAAYDAGTSGLPASGGAVAADQMISVSGQQAPAVDGMSEAEKMAFGPAAYMSYGYSQVRATENENSIGPGAYISDVQSRVRYPEAPNSIGPDAFIASRGGDAVNSANVINTVHSRNSANTVNAGNPQISLNLANAGSTAGIENTANVVYSTNVKVPGGSQLTAGNYGPGTLREVVENKVLNNAITSVLETAELPGSKAE